MAPHNKSNRLVVERVKVPPKPKRPLNGYTAFIKDYWSKNRSKIAERKEKNGLPSIWHALQEWRKLDSIAKKTFVIEAMKDKDRYNTEIKGWKIQREYLKRPANAYALFVKEKWTEASKNSGRRKSFSSMSKSISKEWYKIPAQRYTEFRERYKSDMRNYLAKIEELSHKGMLMDEDVEDFPDEFFDPFWDDSDSGDDERKEKSSKMNVTFQSGNCGSKNPSKPQMMSGRRTNELVEFCPEDT